MSKENGDKKNNDYYSTKDGLNYVIVTKTQNNSSFSNSITHTHLNTIDYHHCIERNNIKCLVI